MKKIGSLCVFAFVCLSSVTGQDKISSDKQLPIMAWAGIPAGETNVDRFKELKEMGININLSTYPNADAMQKALDLA